MVSYTLWLLLTAVAFSAKPECPAVKCKNMDRDICARYVDEVVQINDDGCRGGHYCWVSEMKVWYDGDIQEGEEFLCKEKDDAFDDEKDAYEDSLDDNDDVDCGKRDKDQELKDGENPRQCNTSADCELENGEFAECLCGLDGNSWCRAEWGSEYFDDFWDECDDEDDEVDYDFYTLWASYRTLYSELITAPDCAIHMEEFDRMYDLDDRINSATAIIGVIAILML